MPTWKRPPSVPVSPELADAVGSHPLAELLYRRGFTDPESAVAFLTGGIDVDAPGLPDLEDGVACLVEAVLTGQKICVYGDYDTDGVTSTTLLVDLLRTLGAHVTYYVPNRFRDGYGMNSRAVEALAHEETALILTCDCGIKNVAEVALARKLGMRVVVTDHHELGPELPVAEAVINPKRLPEDHPCRMLPGVGTAYLLARQLYRALDRSPDEADRWLDLVAVGIIADVVPLHGANRELARRGLTRLNTSPCLGLEALLRVSGLEGHITEEEVAFQLVPRLNSPGRLADAGLGVRLLLAQRPDEARDLAAELDQLNQERKRLTATVVDSAMADVTEGQQAILLYRPEWHEGVLGIAAGKLAEEFGLPTLLMSRKHGGGVLVGSARAPGGFALHEALQACADHLLKHGGHAAAAGFSLMEDRFPAFRAAMLEEARRRTTPAAAAPLARTADLELPLEAVDRSVYDDLRRAGPYGEANPAPVLFATGAKVLSARPIGAGDKHLRLVLRHGEQSFVGVWWGAGGAKLQPGEVDLFYRLGLNRWNGEELIQVVVEHLGPPGQTDFAPEIPAAVVTMAPPPPLIAAEQPTLFVPNPTLELVDRRGFLPATLQEEFPTALFAAEGATAATRVDRYSLRTAETLVFLTPPPSPRLLEEALAQTGARRLVLGWPTQPPPEEERFLPTLLRLLAEEMKGSPYVSLGRLAVRTAELEAAVRFGLQALEESDLLAIDEEVGEKLRLRKRTDGRGVKESPALVRMRQLVGESRAFRRFLRQASPEAIRNALIVPR